MLERLLNSFRSEPNPYTCYDLWPYADLNMPDAEESLEVKPSLEEKPFAEAAAKAEEQAHKGRLVVKKKTFPGWQYAGAQESPEYVDLPDGRRVHLFSDKQVYESQQRLFENKHMRTIEKILGINETAPHYGVPEPDVEPVEELQKICITESALDKAVAAANIVNDLHPVLIKTRGFQDARKHRFLSVKDRVSPGEEVVQKRRVRPEGRGIVSENESIVSENEIDAVKNTCSFTPELFLSLLQHKKAPKNLITNVLVAHEQTVSGGSCSQTNRGGSLDQEWIDQHNYTYAGWSHSHGEHNTFHSSIDDRQVNKQLSGGGLVSEYREHGVRIKYLRSLVVNARGDRPWGELGVAYWDVTKKVWVKSLRTVPVEIVDNQDFPLYYTNDCLRSFMNEQVSVRRGRRKEV